MRWSVAALLLLASGCTPAVQRAALAAAFAEPVPVTTSENVQRFAFRSPKARVLVVTNDLVNGDHHLTFTKVRGKLVLDPTTRHGQLHVDVEMDGLVAERAFITDFATYILAVDRYPHATLDAKVEPIEGDTEHCLVTGNMVVRGMERGIVFRAEIGPERFRASFDMSRNEFGIHARLDEGDGIIRDDFTVTFDFRLTKERVVVEQ